MIRTKVINGTFLLAVSLMTTAPSWADSVTYYGGFEDEVGGDYDYNDLVFSLTGADLAIQQNTGVWAGEPTLGTNGSPFWNRSSGDGADYNVGYCIYGGGNCGAGLEPTAQYLATPTGGTVNSVYFTVAGTVDATISYKIAGDTDLLGWYLLSDPSAVFWINSAGSETGTFNFTPTGAFGLVGNNHAGSGGQTFASQDSLGASDPFGSHFAFFDPPAPPTVPEPGYMVLLGTALFSASFMLRRRRRQSRNQ